MHAFQFYLEVTALWIHPSGVINHKLCVITPGRTNRLQGRFEMRTCVRAGDTLVTPICSNVTPPHYHHQQKKAVPVSGSHNTYICISKAALSPSQKHNKQWQGEPLPLSSQPGELETGKHAMCVFIARWILGQRTFICHYESGEILIYEAFL